MTMSYRADLALRRSHYVSDNAIGVVAASIVAIGFFFFFNPIAPLRFIGGSVADELVPRGGAVDVTWHLEWRRICPGTSIRYLRTSDGEIRSIAGITVQPPVFPGDVDRERKIMLPAGAPRGPASIWTVLTIKCWPWAAQTYTVTSPKVAFTIL